MPRNDRAHTEPTQSPPRAHHRAHHRAHLIFARELRSQWNHIRMILFCLLNSVVQELQFCRKYEVGSVVGSVVGSGWALGGLCVGFVIPWQRHTSRTSRSCEQARQAACAIEQAACQCLGIVFARSLARSFARWLARSLQRTVRPTSWDAQAPR